VCETGLTSVKPRLSQAMPWRSPVQVALLALEARHSTDVMSMPWHTELARATLPYDCHAGHQSVR